MTTGTSDKDSSFRYLPPLNALENLTGIDFNIDRRFYFGEYVEKKIVQHGKEIPKRVNFIWTDDKIPVMFVENIRSFRRHNPDWDILIWTLQIGRYLIARKESHLLHTFDGHKMNVVKADIIKYVILYHYGGAYFDLDTRSVNALSTFIEDKECILSAEAQESAIVLLRRHSVLASSVFLCRAQHPLFRHYLDMLPFYGLEKNIMAAAGPLFVTWNLRTFIDRQAAKPQHDPTTINVVSHEYFEDRVFDSTNVRFAKLCYQNIRFRPARPRNISSTNIHQHIDLPHNGFVNILQYWNKDLYPDPSIWSRIVQQACGQWQSRGAVLRKLSPRALVEHSHYGSYTEKSRNEINRSAKIQINEILPDIKIPSIEEIKLGLI